MADEGWAETDFGEWEGLTHAEAAQRWPGAVDAWLADTGVAPPGGESFAATSVRVLAALEALVAAHPGATVLIVSHVTPMKIALRHALLAPPAALRRMHLDVACLCEIDWYAGRSRAWCGSLNDTAHLRRATADWLASAYAGERGGRVGRAAAPVPGPRGIRPVRKVRAPQGRVVGNADPG